MLKTAAKDSASRNRAFSHEAAVAFLLELHGGKAPPPLLPSPCTFEIQNTAGSPCIIMVEETVALGFAGSKPIPFSSFLSEMRNRMRSPEGHENCKCQLEKLVLVS